jgi:hypothetical protein
MATTRRTQCANKMPWPAGNHRSLDRFLDDAERAGVLDTIANHPGAATTLALPPHSLDAATVGTVLRHADSREQGAAFPSGWKLWQERVGDQYPDQAAAAEGFADFTGELTGDDWESGEGTPAEELFATFVDAAVTARADGTSTRDALDAVTGNTTE